MYNYGEGVGGSSQGRQYHGYPYANSMVIDVPTIDAATAARYTNLPRRPWVKEDNPVVYIDLPSGSQSSVSQPNASSLRQEDQESPTKVDPDENPVVYIDLPERNGSDVAERRRDVEQESFVQETIFYDPFKDRRIERDQSDSEESTSAGPSSSSRPNRPTPPNTLDLGSPSRGRGNYLPASFSKEPSVYGPLTPPNGYPEPPPAYSEREATPVVTETATSPESNDSGTASSPTEPARTQVLISPESNPDRKLLYCIYCGLRGHSLIIKQSGFATHVVAIILCVFGLIPLLLFVYCTDVCKYKNHYCKNCNERIAYEIPMLCKEVTYRSDILIIESQQINYDLNINDRLMQEESKRIEEQYNKDLIQGLNLIDIYINNNNPDIKRSLDNFKIKRKITNFNLPQDMALNKNFIVSKVDKVTDHTVLYQPDNAPKIENQYIPNNFNLPEHMALNKKLIVRKVDNVTNHNVLYSPDDAPKIENPYIPKNFNSPEDMALNKKFIVSKVDKVKDPNNENLPNTDRYTESDEELFYKNPEVFNILKIQTDLMEKFIKVLENDLKKTLRSYDKDFEDLIGLSDIPPSTIKDAKNYRITTPRPNITIVNSIDELKMTEKLKNDPLVKRIIAMAKLKRKQYFEKLSTYTPDPQ